MQGSVAWGPGLGNNALHILKDFFWWSLDRYFIDLFLIGFLFICCLSVPHSTEVPIECVSMRSLTSPVTWWSSWMTVLVCLIVFITAMSTRAMLWTATGSSTSTLTIGADSTSWNLGNTGGTETGVPPAPSLDPSGGSQNFSHQENPCKYLTLCLLKILNF